MKKINKLRDLALEAEPKQFTFNWIGFKLDKLLTRLKNGLYR